MPAYTEHLILYLPGGGSLGIGGDDESADIDKLNQNFQKIDDWSEATDTRLVALEPQLQRNQQYRGLAADLPSVTGMRLGDTYQETDGDKKRWYYDGTNWISNENGMYLIRPTTVVNATINPDGSVSPTASVSNFTINGIFTPRFKRYLIVANTRAGGGHFTSLQLCASGTAYAGSTHQLQRTSAVGTTVATSSTGGSPATSLPLGNFVSAVGVDSRIQMSGPAHSSPKTYIADVVDLSNASTAWERGSVTGVDATIYDGLKFTANGGGLYTTATEIRVYGLV